VKNDRWTGRHREKNVGLLFSTVCFLFRGQKRQCCLFRDHPLEKESTRATEANNHPRLPHPHSILFDPIFICWNTPGSSSPLAVCRFSVGYNKRCHGVVRKKRDGFNSSYVAHSQSVGLGQNNNQFTSIFHLEPSIHEGDHLRKPFSNIDTPLPRLLTHFEDHGPWTSCPTAVSQFNRKRYLRWAEFSFTHHRPLTMNPSIWDILFVVVWPWVSKKVYSFLVFVCLHLTCDGCSMLAVLFFSFRLLHLFWLLLKRHQNKTHSFHIMSTCLQWSPGSRCTL